MKAKLSPKGGAGGGPASWLIGESYTIDNTQHSRKYLTHRITFILRPSLGWGQYADPNTALRLIVDVQSICCIDMFLLKLM